MPLPMRTALDTQQTWDTFKSWLLAVWDFSSASGVVNYATHAALLADTTQLANTNGRVLNDPDPAKNGYYIWISPAWTRTGLQPADALSLQTLTGRVDTVEPTVTALYGRVDVVEPAVTALQGDVQVLDTITPPPSYPGELPWGIVDKYGQPILGVRPDGVALALLDAMPGTGLLDGRFRWAMTDAQGYVVLGVQWDGGVYVSGSSSGTIQVFVIDGDVWAIAEDQLPVQVTSGARAANPALGGIGVRYLAPASGGMVSAESAIPLATAWAPFITRVLHIVSAGQSLAIGIGATAWTLKPQCANRLRTLQIGVSLSNQDATLNAADCLPLKPLTANTLEAPVVQQANQLQRIGALPSNAGVVASAHGRGGLALADLDKGTLYYTNSITAVTKAKEEATAAGLSYRVPYIDWIQGENDRASAAGVYLTALLGLQADYDADVRAISGQSEVVPLLLDQISNWTAYNIDVSLVPFDQLAAARQYPSLFYCAGPKYWLATVDGIHMTSLSSRRLGAMHARAGAAIIKGEAWLPTHCTSAVRAGNVVTLKFHTPEGRLMADTINVANPGNLGIRWVDDGASATVTGVQVNLDNTVTVTLSGAPTGANGYIGIADIGTSGAAGGPTIGPRACLRDSSTDKCGDGLPLYNWACHQRISVA